MAKELNESNFHEAIQNSKGLVLVDFFTTWCGPCRMLTPVLEQLRNVVVVKIDGDQNQNLVAEHKVSAYPTMVFYLNGREVGRELGLKSVEALQTIVDEYNGE